MLPVFHAISVDQYALDGGTTQPCLMMVEDENGHIQASHYVVKIFKRGNRAATCREVFAQTLASEFDLQVPKAALVEVDSIIFQDLKRHERYAQWDIEPGWYFATEYLSDAKIFSPTMPFSLLDSWDMERIFAFDVLIRNSDRRVGKPNFLLHQQVPVLIDHELSLRVNKPFSAYVANQDWGFLSMEGNRDHVFLAPLRKKFKKDGLDFSSILEYLRTLKPRMLFPYAEQLLELGYEEAEIVNPITDYLQDVKANSHLFPKILTDLVQ